MIITIASFSFQIAGAILLLLWSLKNTDIKIKAMCLEHNLTWGSFDNHKTISAEKLQSKAKTVYLNILAFVNITIGYSCAIFTPNIDIEKWLIFIFVVLFTLLIIILELLFTNLYVKKRYSKDENVCETEILEKQ